MKTLLIILSLILLFTLNAQNYTLVRTSFNATGGTMQNSQFQAVTAVAEDDQGSSATANYSGYLGFLFPLLDQSPPVITSIDDVPNDQGRKVQIVWNKCAFDDEYSIDTFYSIWRLEEDFEVLLGAGGDFSKISDSKNKRVEQLSRNSQPTGREKFSENIYIEPFIIIKRARENSNKTYYWQRDDEVWTFVDEVPALNYNEYSLIAETLADSSSAGTNEATFKVVFHDDFAYYESESANGYSTDDIAPDATSNVTIAVNQSFRNSTITLSWDEVEYGTFEGNRYEEINGIWYKVYASDTPEFDCDETTFLETTTDLDYDFPLTGEDMKFFKVVVSDKP